MTATVDLDEVVSFRASISSLREQASSTVQPAFVQVDFNLCRASGLVDPPKPVRVSRLQLVQMLGGCHVLHN